MASTVRTTCPYCGVGCGVLARSAAGSAEISGDPEHPANRGRLCSKGMALGETLGLTGRLLYPEIRGQRVRWDHALDYVSAQFGRVLAAHGPEAVAFYVSGQLLTEDYYVANKLMKGFIGAANIDTNSRLCMASAVVGHVRAFGEDVVPGCYEDFELADLIVLVGANMAWCHPVLFHRIVQAKERRPELKLVAIDPRRTPTCAAADLHLPIRPGTDVWLFNGLLAQLHRQGQVDPDFVNSATSGAPEALRVAETSAPDLETVAAVCGCDAERLGEFFRLFARTERVVTAFSQGVNQSSAGTDKVNSIINCHLLTGRIARPGMGVFSLTGQPNAMGGREVGGMANALAAHMQLGDPVHRRIVQQFWASPRLAAREGLKAVELFEAMHAGRIKAVWIMATNPTVSLPNADRGREALARCDLVVVSDCVQDTDTNRLAHVLLPAAGWGEKDGTVTNSERRISRQRAFLPRPGEAQPDWWIVSEVAKRMGFAAAFAYDSPGEIFDEHARLSSHENRGARAFDIGGLAGLSCEQYEALEPIQWPVRRRGDGASRLFEDRRFMHADGRARLVPIVPRAPAHPPEEAFALILNSGRVRDQWHTMTRTGRSPRLAEHDSEPFVDLHAHDALLAGIRAEELARVTTRWGAMVARVRTSGEVARGQLFAPIHWNSTNASDARAGALVNPAVDPLSGEPEFKHTPARIEPFVVDWYGLIVVRRPLEGLEVVWWTLVRGESWLRYEVAGRGVPSDWPGWSRRLLGATAADADYLDYYDEGAGIYRAACLVSHRLDACIYVSRAPQLPARGWLASLFAQSLLADTDRMALLAGRPLGQCPDGGPLICSCFAVGRDAIRQAIRANALRTPKEIGARLKAGTNCGSCLPEIRTLIAESSS
jgi:assimilatory nitrate reductase catalytic subunit